MDNRVELLPRKEFRINIGDKTITGKYGTWALKRFCDKRQYSLAQVSEALANRPSLSDMTEFILCAVEQSFRELRTKESFPYTDLDVCEWIDELGGISGDNLTALLNHAGSEEKKTEAIAD